METSDDSENAFKQKLRAPVLIQSKPNALWLPNQSAKQEPAPDAFGEGQSEHGQSRCHRLAGSFSPLLKWSAGTPACVGAFSRAVRDKTLPSDQNR
jgi:hypothetical protein